MPPLTHKLIINTDNNCENLTHRQMIKPRNMESFKTDKRKEILSTDKHG